MQKSNCIFVVAQNDQVLIEHPNMHDIAWSEVLLILHLIAELILPYCFAHSAYFSQGRSFGN